MIRRAALAPFVFGGLVLATPTLAASPTKAPADAPPVTSVSVAVNRFKCAGRSPCLFGAGAGAVFENLSWGWSRAQVVAHYNKPGGVFDQEYNPELARLPNGSREVVAKEAERDDRKRAFEASVIEFKSTPTGFDATPLRYEYTYRNKESVLSVDVAGGRKRYFFFIGAPPVERLWKVYEEVPLGEGTPLGKTFEDALTSVNVYLASKGRLRGADASQGLASTTADWQDDKSHLRLVDRSREGLVAVVLEDRSILAALPQLRTNKLDDPFAMDPSVQAITSGSLSDPNAAKDGGKDSKGRKKK